MPLPPGLYTNLSILKNLYEPPRTITNLHSFTQPGLPFPFEAIPVRAKVKFKPKLNRPIPETTLRQEKLKQKKCYPGTTTTLLNTAHKKSSIKMNRSRIRNAGYSI